MRFSIQYGAGPSLDIEAVDRERAWDQYKLRTGLRRRPGDEPPKILEIPAVLAAGHADLEDDHGPDSGGDRQPKDGQG